MAVEAETDARVQRDGQTEPGRERGGRHDVGRVAVRRRGRASHAQEGGADPDACVGLPGALGDTNDTCNPTSTSAVWIRAVPSGPLATVP
ncbi:hypothetical protein OV079_51220 [Nannocystis pusilla]|uniref:Uncharacterized protein n=1 Tax=Nannocystis pusilla TaxID=889268 RepID=A0A9X3F0I3_9BACT|nr:hypothetical protein [Nannocystis pusilla]MCY1013763.1 hypothetical protein [Nannocystis pusilla]